MSPEETPDNPAGTANPFATSDVVQILREQGWLSGDSSAPQLTWCERAAALLGPQVSDRASLADLLHLVFHYDAQEILAKVESHSALSRTAARDVVRHLALLLLDDAPLTPERFSEIINSLKDGTGIRSRELFHPLRLALTGRAGEGELDRVILLLDAASPLGFAAPVKSARERILEFCSALD